MALLPERRYTPWRKYLWSLVEGPKVLEVGVGTGRNMLLYPSDIEITAIDLTPGMLVRAKRRASELGLDVDLRIGDVQNMEFPDDTFDTAVATCVFCSVTDPILGLKEVLRVIKPGGNALFIEHVRSENPLIGALMDLVNPLVVHTMGPNINRHTVQNIQQAEFNIEKVEDLGAGGIFKLIVARKSIKLREV
jgi:ubiquinone/menaquinone biosynthesis C-methylase UbiE